MGRQFGLLWFLIWCGILFEFVEDKYIGVGGVLKLRVVMLIDASFVRNFCVGSLG